ncbi:hypothetical protein [Pelagibius sp. Alg239-R121]|uniref:hypothetical protein n=1 Tax=Pelagibius sp. Alg239-R121 TaxID=2993448 RepID=UPI0024A71738|nr:hypothetical protein [Pelagibius sp. Alg239-R121]
MRRKSESARRHCAFSNGLAGSSDDRLSGFAIMGVIAMGRTYAASLWHTVLAAHSRQCLRGQRD